MVGVFLSFGLLLDALSVYVVSYLGITLEALGFCAVSFVLTALGVYVIASGHLGRGASKAVFADFFGRRGADIQSPRPWAFRERVIVDEEGITICYGPIGAPDDQLRMVRKAWGESAGLLRILPLRATIVLCKAKTGPAARWLLGFDFAYYDQKRNTFEDASYFFLAQRAYWHNATRTQLIYPEPSGTLVVAS